VEFVLSGVGSSDEILILRHSILGDMPDLRSDLRRIQCDCARASRQAVWARFIFRRSVDHRFYFLCVCLSVASSSSASASPKAEVG
jgi:hypothetical protein